VIYLSFVYINRYIILLTRSCNSPRPDERASEQTSRSKPASEDFRVRRFSGRAIRYTQLFKFHLSDRFSCADPRAYTLIGSDLNTGLSRCVTAISVTVFAARV